MRLQLRPLCQVRVQFVDAAGKPLQAVTAGATWTKNGDGFWTEGTQSDKDGRAVLYLNAPDGLLQNVVSAFQSAVGGGEAQYVRGHGSGAAPLISDGFREVHPVAGKVIDLRITMVPPASIQGKVAGVVLPSGPSGGDYSAGSEMPTA